MTEKFFPYDPTAFLDSIEAIEFFLNDAFETGDAGYISAAIRDVARVTGHAVAGEPTRLNPEIDVTHLAAAISMLDTLGFRLTVTPRSALRTTPPRPSFAEELSAVPNVGDEADFDTREP